MSAPTPTETVGAHPQATPTLPPTLKETVTLIANPLVDTTLPYPPPVTAVPYPTSQQQEVIPVCPPSGTEGPYPIPCIKVRTPGPSPTLPPTFTPAPTPIPSPTRLSLPTDSSTETPSPVRIIQIRMFDAYTGWAVNSNSNIQRTTAGVLSWKNVNPPITEGYRCTTASFLDANTAVVGCVHSYLPNSIKFEITTWRTLDAGRTWVSGELISANRGLVAEIHILMLDSEQGWMLGIGEGSMGTSPISFFSTQDGGMHWKPDYRTIPGDEPELWSHYSFYPYLDDFALVSGTHGFFSNRSLYVSKDGALTWAPFLLEPPADLPDLNCTCGCSQCKYAEAISAPRFTSSQDGVLIRRVYTNTQAVREEFAYSYSIHQLPLPEAQYLYFTYDGGQTWTPRPSPAKLGTAYFLDKNIGWFLGKNGIDPTTPTQLYQTTDSGETWSLVSADCPVPLGSEFQFADAQAGFAFDTYQTLRYYSSADFRIGEALTHAHLFYTRDGGRTWDKVVPIFSP